MREFSTLITEALVNGLKPNEGLRDSSFFKDLYNLVPYPEGPRPYEPVTNVLDFEEDMYPFPQWFKFEKHNIAVTKDKLYLLDDGYVPFDLALLNTEASDWRLSIFSKPFRGVDYGDNWILLSPEGAVYKFQGKVRSTKELQVSAAVKHKGRTILGGSPNGLWTEGWKLALEEFLTKSEFDSTEFKVPLGKNFVLWSSFGSTDFPFALLHPEILLNTTGSRSLFTESLYSNEFGFMEMPFSGSVLDIVELNDILFVFGEDGICALAQVPESSGSGYGIISEQNFGIKQRGAVGGDENMLVFISSLNDLWLLTGQGLEKLGFKSYMQELSGEIFITKDPDEGLFYIGDGKTSFVLNGDKLTRVHQTVMKTDGSYDFKAGVVKETGDKVAYFETDKIDIGISALKTLTGVTVGLDYDVKGKVLALGEVKGRLNKTKKVPLNSEGYGHVRVIGKNHIVRCEFDTYENLNLDTIELKWQIDDNRHRRGIFATQDTTGTGQ